MASIGYLGSLKLKRIYMEGGLWERTKISNQSFGRKQKLVKYKNPFCIRKLTTTAEYTHPCFPKILRPSAGMCLIVEEKP